MAFFPALLSGNLFKAAEKVFNSPEHNFKMDLDDTLKQAGVSDRIRARIKQLLNTGSDSEIGGKLNALMAAGVIPPELASVIGSLAQSNGVPSNSIDPYNIGQPMDSTECASIIGGSFPDEVDAMDDDPSSDDGSDDDSDDDDSEDA